MRKYISIITAGILLAAAVVLSSCTGNFEKYNRNQDQVDELNMDVWDYLSNMEYAVIDNVKNQYQIVENVSGGAYGRYFAYAQSTSKGWDNGMYAFFGTSDWSNPPFETPMTNIYSNWRAIMKELGEDAEGDYQVAIAQILRIAAMQRVTDQQGPIPYRNMENTTAVFVPYESQESVYRNMLEDLSTAITDIQKHISLTGETQTADINTQNKDYVYKADLTKWIKFGNSLMLRMAMRISYVDDEAAEEYAVKAVSDAYGVITSNDDNAAVDFSKANDQNPLRWLAYEYKDTHAAAEIVTYLKNYADPRLAAYFSPAVTSGQYYGSRVGVKSTSSWYDDYSLPKVNATDRIMWMNAAEVAFLKAEMALNGWAVAGTAEELYNEGIRLSFEQYGIKTDGDIYTDYLASTALPGNYTDPRGGSNSFSPTVPHRVTVAWNSTDKEVLREKVITQKWIALYPLGTEAWAEQRRTGYPRFYPTPAANNNQSSTEPNLHNVGASRILYAPNEKNRNPYYDDAVALLGAGGDKFGTKMWWDVKTNKPAW